VAFCSCDPRAVFLILKKKFKKSTRICPIGTGKVEPHKRNKNPRILVILG